MRLINTHTLTLEEHQDPIPPYAILSHTWGQQEVDFRRFQGLGAQEREEVKRGRSKIGSVCRVARQHGHGHVWVDTCCIDKSSSADLSEAVNSMYRYYQEAQVCYAYLADVVVAVKTTTTTTTTTTNENENENEKSTDTSKKVKVEVEEEEGEGEGGEKEKVSSLRNCRWFRRGWTLQELIAPRRVAFYDQGWRPLGEKTDPALLRLLASITSVDEDVLANLEPVTSVPVSKRMSWAADRRCARPEDVAYSLMGIFDVNMPLLYGEGPKAFARLQEEISRRNLDLSLLAWASDDDGERHRGLLARSPAEFRIFRKVTLVRAALDGQSEVTVVNGCLRLSGKVFTRAASSSSSSRGVSSSHVLLDLGWVGKAPNSGSGSGSDASSCFFWRVGILLQRALGAFVRATPQKLFAVKLEDVQHTRALHMRMSLTPSDLESLRRLPVDLAPSSGGGGGGGEGKHGGAAGLGAPSPSSRYEYEWGSYTSTGCRTKQIETMFDHGLCLDMRHSNQNGRVLRGLEPWALRPTLFWRVWPGGNSNTTTAVKVFLRYYNDTPHSSRRLIPVKHSHGQERFANKWTTNHHHSRPVPIVTMAEPPRKRRRDSSLSSVTAANNLSTPPVTAHHHQPYPVLFPSRSLACPFYMRDKLRHTPCKDTFLHTIHDVQQHLARNHVRPPTPTPTPTPTLYCPICKMRFDGIGARDEHIVCGTCTPTTPPNPSPTTTTTTTTTEREEQDGRSTTTTVTITEAHHRRVVATIKKAAGLGLADFEVWYRVWEELFPGARYPPSVWLGSEAEEVGEITGLIWNRFLVDMRRRDTTGGCGGCGCCGGCGKDGEEEDGDVDGDVVKHFELSQLSAVSCLYR